ncbi:hypothetical protein ACIOTI_43135 [Streptomyces sp. NPDC087843]|uniref:hypothetical protein n=1 Tax=Streptomyces sp. NPDC087843 TaxID=3365804 RepID=UPI0037F677D6
MQVLAFGAVDGVGELGPRSRQPQHPAGGVDRGVGGRLGQGVVRAGHGRDPSWTLQQLVPAFEGGQGSLVGGQPAGPALGQTGQRQLGRRDQLRRHGGRGHRRGPALQLGGLAGLQRDHVRGARSDRQGGEDPGDDVALLQVPVQQQDVTSPIWVLTSRGLGV